MTPFFRSRMASQRRKDAAFDLMIRARGILNLDEDAVASVLAEGCCGAHGAAPVVGRFENDRS